MLVLRKHAVSMLGLEACSSFHLLPLICCDAELIGLAPKVMMSGALDLERSTVRRLVPSGAIFKVDKYFFNFEVLENIVSFKVSELRFSPIFVTDRFVEKWKSCGLVGIDFQKLWGN